MPVACSAAETEAIRRLLQSMRPRPLIVAIGGPTDGLSTLNTNSVRNLCLNEHCIVQGPVAWQETVASWLPQARSFTDPAPDAWIITGGLAGWAGMARRLLRWTTWDPRRTIAMAGLADPEELIIACGVGTFDGLRGTRGDGRTWEIHGGMVLNHADPAPTP